MCIYSSALNAFFEQYLFTSTFFDVFHTTISAEYIDDMNQISSTYMWNGELKGKDRIAYVRGLENIGEWSLMLKLGIFSELGW